MGLGTASILLGARQILILFFLRLQLYSFALDVRLSLTGNTGSPV